MKRNRFYAPDLLETTEIDYGNPSVCVVSCFNEEKKVDFIRR